MSSDRLNKVLTNIPQDLSEEEKAIARSNIGAVGFFDAGQIEEYQTNYFRIPNNSFSEIYTSASSGSLIKLQIEKESDVELPNILCSFFSDNEVGVAVEQQDKNGNYRPLMYSKDAGMAIPAQSQVAITAAGAFWTWAEYLGMM